MTEPRKDKPVRIYTDLIGDLFHAGHVGHLEKAKSLGDILILGIFDDDTAAQLSHVPVMPLEERVAIVAALRCVDEVIPAAPALPDQTFLDRYEIDQICLTDDFENAERQEVMADLLESGAGIVLPYTEATSTAGVVARITGTDAAEIGQTGDGATIHSPETLPLTELRRMLTDIRQTQALTLDALGATAAAVFTRGDPLNRKEIGDESWRALLKGLAGNRIEQKRHTEIDPRFAAALISLTERVSASGDRVNLIGAAAPLVGSALSGTDRRVVIIRPGATPPTGTAGISAAECEVIHCGWPEFPDACPPADVMTVMDPAASTVLLMDGELLFAATTALKRSLLLAVRLSPDTGARFTVGSNGLFAFPDVFVRTLFHRNGFFEVSDLLTTVDGMPKPDGDTGCNRISRVSLVEGDQHGGSFRYLDGEAAAACGKVGNSEYIRWYHASKTPIADTVT